MSFSVNSLLGEVKSRLESKIEVRGDIPTEKVADPNFRPSDVNIQEISISSFNKEKSTSLIQHANRIDIFESIYSPVIYAELQMQDADGLYSRFPLIGQEFIKISFSTPGSTPTTYTFINRGIPVNFKQNENLKSVTYTLKLVSVDALFNLTATSLNNKGEFVPKIVKDNVTGIVKDILKEDLKVKVPIHVSNTKGVVKDKIFYGLSSASNGEPSRRLTPFMWISKYAKILAKSTRYESHTFDFFLNKHGYFFVPKEELIEKGVKALAKNESDKRFFFDTTRNEDNRNVRMRDILAYNHINNSSDTVEYISDSGNAGAASSLDTLTFGYKTLTYGDNIGADKFQRTDENAGNQFTSDFTRLFQTVTNTRLVSVRSDLPNLDYIEKLVKTQAFISKMDLNKLLIEVYGDSELTVGDVIECTLPAAITATDVNQEMRLHSGNYLVASLRHMILNTGRPQHVISMALEKNGLVE
jgi:hypothetical protein